MELALLVYGISVIGSIVPVVGTLIGISLTVSIFCAIAIITWMTDGSEYSWNLNSDGSLKEKVAKMRNTTKSILKWATAITVVSTLIMIIVPSQKTAWTMVGAYAAQRVSEDPRAAEVGGKVLSVINQQLDRLIEEGAAKVVKKTEKAVEKVTQ